MENVYIALIVVFGVVIIIWLLHERITGVKTNIDLKNKEFKGEIKAAPPGKDSAKQEKHARVPQSGIIGNVVSWWSRIRTPANARVVDNKVKAGSSIEVVSEEPKKDDNTLSKKKQKK